MGEKDVKLMDRYTLQELIDRQPDAKLKDHVLKLLYDEIIALRIKPGTRLNVNQLASQLGISRTPVAEAVAELTEMGFVVNRPEQAGSFVLELSLPEAGELLNRAGFSLTRSSKFDVILEYCLSHGIYNVFEINEVLFSYDLPLLGSGMG